MRKKFALKDLEPLISETLERGCDFLILPNGVSMLPLLRPGEDKVYLSPIPENICVGDMFLYKRNDETFILHRIMKIEDDSYTFSGDNEIPFEKGIKKEQLIAHVNHIIRDGKNIFLNDYPQYQKYVRRLIRKKKLLNTVTLPFRIIKCKFSK